MKGNCKVMGKVIYRIERYNEPGELNRVVCGGEFASKNHVREYILGQLGLKRMHDTPGRMMPLEDWCGNAVQRVARQIGKAALADRGGWLVFEVAPPPPPPPKAAPPPQHAPIDMEIGYRVTKLEKQVKNLEAQIAFLTTRSATKLPPAANENSNGEERTKRRWSPITDSKIEEVDNLIIEHVLAHPGSRSDDIYNAVRAKMSCGSALYQSRLRHVVESRLIVRRDPKPGMDRRIFYYPAESKASA